MLSLLQDIVLALFSLASILVVGIAGLKLFRVALTDLDLVAFGAGLGVLIHGLAGLAMALSPAKQVTARIVLFLLWCVAGLIWWRSRKTGTARAGFLEWQTSGVRSTLAVLSSFIVLCVTLSHAEIRFPRALPDGRYIFKSHTMPIKLQVLCGGLPADNYIPFIVQEFLLRDISFRQERPILPGQEVSNRPILMALTTIPFRAAIKSPPRQARPLDRFFYVWKDFPDVGVFLEGDGFHRFLAVGIVLNSLVLLGAALLFANYGPRRLFLPGLLLLGTSPFYLSQTIFTWPKCLAAFFILLALYALLSEKDPIWVAGAAVLAYYSHPFAAVFLVLFACHYAGVALLKRQRFDLRRFICFSASTVLGLIPWFFWTQIVLGLPSDLITQNVSGPGGQSLSALIQIRLFNFWHALTLSTLRAFPPDTTTAARSLVCLPGVLGLLVFPAYAGCVFCLRGHRLLVLYGILLPAILLALPFSIPRVPLTLVVYHSVIVCLLLVGLIVIARLPPAVALTLIVLQMLLQVGLLLKHGRALGATFVSKGVVYRL